MKAFTILTILLLQFSVLLGQTPMKQIQDKETAAPKPLQIGNTPGTHSSGRLGNDWRPGSMATPKALPSDVESFQISASGSFWIDMKPNQRWQGRASISNIMESLISMKKHQLPVDMGWKVIGEDMDEQQVSHIRVVQTLGDIPIHRQDMIVHISHGQLRDINGFIWTAGVPDKLPAPGSQSAAIEAAKQFLTSSNVAFAAPKNLIGFELPEDAASLVWYPKNGNLVLAYEVDMHPNALDHWKLFVDASTSAILESYSQLCTFNPVFYKDAGRCVPHTEEDVDDHADHFSPMTMMDGSTVTTDQDLLGQNRTVNGYQVGNRFFMIDASRSGMYQPTQSNMPDEPTGVIWTIDAFNTSPQNQNFEVDHVSNTNNNWKNLEVSAHYNAGKAYEYFLNTFTRNSINGGGGNIISIINVAEDNGGGMDNAFWNGSAMFYGNGATAFKELARGLDVAGHEMSHGVIQNTANLEYVGQSGALNESYADVFGALIDRDDWKMGEDVVKPGVFPTGALRDLSNPNNGGNSLGDPGWQPKNMDEYANLPNTPQGDNGGVHVNSGIPNRAFFLLASNIGREKAEQIYYKALRDYLVKSSKFVDMRLAAEKAAKDIHGNTSPELDAVRGAFNTVGIGGGTGGEYEEDIEVNEGDDFIIATDESDSDLYWVPPTNPSQFVKMDVNPPISRPSFTDNGAACVYVDNENNMILLNFDWSQGLSFEQSYLESEPQGIWRNIAVSKDGARVAYITADLSNDIYIFDFVTGANDFFTLTNPTTAEGGVSTGDVLYSDVLEWSYSGDYVMYDALSKIESSFGNGIEYWDIAFLQAWDLEANALGNGQIGKLFSSLPETVSVGNPSFAKNSPYIIVFDFLEAYFDQNGQAQIDYIIKAANIEAQELSDIFQNTTVGFPNYSSEDDKILFTYDDNGSLVLATIDVEVDNKIHSVPGSEVGLLSGGQKGVWFATGEREFTSTTEATALKPMLVSPQPATDFITVETQFIGTEADYTIRDITGKGIAQGKLNTDGRVDVSSLAAGSYVLVLKEDGGLFYRAKFIKQ